MYPPYQRYNAVELPLTINSLDLSEVLLSWSQQGIIPAVSAQALLGTSLAFCDLWARLLRAFYLMNLDSPLGPRMRSRVETEED